MICFSSVVLHFLATALIGLNSFPLWTSRTVMWIRKHHQSLHRKWVKCPFWVIYPFNPTTPPPPPLESGLQNFLAEPIWHTRSPVYVKCDDFKHFCAPLAACLQSHVNEMPHNFLHLMHIYFCPQSPETGPFLFSSRRLHLLLRGFCTAPKKTKQTVNSVISANPAVVYFPMSSQNLEKKAVFERTPSLPRLFNILKTKEDKKLEWPGVKNVTRRTRKTRKYGFSLRTPSLHPQCCFIRPFF